MSQRPSVGAFAERLAAEVLERHRGRIVARNLRLTHGGLDGELDLLAVIDGWRVAVEVRSARAPRSALEAFGPDKASRVRSLASAVGADRVDLMAVTFWAQTVDVHWVRSVC